MNLRDTTLYPSLSCTVIYNDSLLGGRTYRPLLVYFASSGFLEFVECLFRYLVLRAKSVSRDAWEDVHFLWSGSLRETDFYVSCCTGTGLNRSELKPTWVTESYLDSSWASLSKLDVLFQRRGSLWLYDICHN